jgi:surface antigen
MKPAPLLHRGVLPALFLSVLFAAGGCSWTGSLLEGAEASPPPPEAAENGLSHSLVKAMLDPAAFRALSPDVARALDLAVQRALETAPDGTIRRGANLAGDVRWSVTPLDTRVGPDIICRSFTNESIIAGTHYVHTALACRKINGAWEIRGN